MTDRYFQNFMQGLIEETSAVQSANEDEEEEEEEEEEGSVGLETEPQDSLFFLLSMPYPNLSARFARAASDLKETIVAKTWRVKHDYVHDYTLYTGLLGTAFLLLKSFQVTGNRNDLELSSHIINACDSASARSRDITFLCGRAGVCALGAVVANNLDNEPMSKSYWTQFELINVNKDHPNEMLYGRAGYLWAFLFLSKNFNLQIFCPAHMCTVMNILINNGRKLGMNSNCPLMYQWYGMNYWGAAHGLAGIMYVLMHFDLLPNVLLEIKSTLMYMIKNKFPNGNYPSCEEDMITDNLVHWCHGAPGMALTFIKAAEVFEDDEFVKAAIDAAEVVWKRGLLKRVGLCHGISGNAYVFLSLFRFTRNVKYLHRAKAFSCFLLDRGEKLILEGKMHGGDNPYSLFEGVGGMAYLFYDMIDPANSRFPGYEL